MGFIFLGIKVDANVHVNFEGFPLYYKWVVVSFFLKYFYPYVPAEMMQFDWYFSTGLVQPPPR